MKTATLGWWNAADIDGNFCRGLGGTAMAMAMVDRKGDGDSTSIEMIGPHLQARRTKRWYKGRVVMACAQCALTILPPRHSLTPRWARPSGPHRRSQPHDHQGRSWPLDLHRERGARNSGNECSSGTSVGLGCEIGTWTIGRIQPASGRDSCRLRDSRRDRARDSRRDCGLAPGQLPSAQPAWHRDSRLDTGVPRRQPAWRRDSRRDSGDPRRDSPS
jgi:hypothetical protein